MTIVTEPISAAQLDGLAGEDAVRVVDTRPLAAFNGWRLDSEARGGHIPGAIAIPADWLPRLEDADLQELLRSHDLHAGSLVVLVQGEADSTALTAALEGLGAHVRVLDGGWPAWIADPERPVDALPLHEQLVFPDWLQAVLDGDRPEAAPAGPHLLFHVNFGVPEEYADGHLPGAIYLDTNWLEDPADWNRRSPEELDLALRRLGITTATT
ncbi:MAG TPA: rhodanese-like domain-containing protein, partial [Candidatus Limnocylindrales bacterium]